MPHNLRSSDVEGDADEFNEDGDASEPAPVSKGLAGTATAKLADQHLYLWPRVRCSAAPNLAYQLACTRWHGCLHMLTGSKTE